jgi:hypothetical protein
MANAEGPMKPPGPSLFLHRIIRRLAEIILRPDDPQANLLNGAERLKGVIV